MQAILYKFVMLVTRVHNYLLTLNNQFENSFTDKELHFLIVGAFGVAMTGSGSTVFGLVPDDFKSVPWCSGRTGVFDTLSLGSNPSGTTIR